MSVGFVLLGYLKSGKKQFGCNHKSQVGHANDTYYFFTIFPISNKNQAVDYGMLFKMRRIIVETGCEMQILAMMKLQVPHKIKLLSLTTPLPNRLIVPQLYT